MDDGWWLAVVVGGWAFIWAGLKVVGRGVGERIVKAVSFRCPACEQPTIELDLATHPGGLDEATGGQMFHCTACRAEFRRAGDGPLIPRAAWDAGAREPLPKARTVERRRVD